MSDPQQLSLEEEKLLAPLHLDLEVTVNGVKLASKCFVRQSDWEGLKDDAAREQQIRDGLAGMADSVLDLIEERDLLHPASPATV